MKHKLKRTLALLLAVLMLGGMLPMSAFAAADGTSPPAITENAVEAPAADTGGGGAPPPDSTPPPDSAPLPDSTPPPDGGASSDSTLPPDSTPLPDGGASSDNTLPPDSMPPSDSSVPSNGNADNETEQEDEQEEQEEQEEQQAFVPLEIAEISTTFTGKPGELYNGFGGGTGTATNPNYDITVCLHQAQRNKEGCITE